MKVLRCTVASFDPYLHCTPNVYRQIRIPSDSKSFVYFCKPLKKYDISDIIFTGFKYPYILNIALKWGGPKMLFDSKLVSKTSQE